MTFPVAFLDTPEFMHPLYHLITLPIDYRNQIIYESTLKVVLPELSNNQDLQPIKCEIKSNEYYKCSDKEKWKKSAPGKIFRY